MAGVRVTALTKVFPGGVRAIDELDVEIEDGEFFALLGPSGCGKTTLLRTLAGLETPTSGSIVIGERDVTRLPPGARDVAMVFQDYALYPHMTVVDNIAYPLKIKRVAKAERRAKARDVGAHLGLDAMLARRPAQLSGGQQQRVALARAIAYRPRLFLLDEPLSNLDARLRLEARTFLKRLHTEVQTTTVYVTHDQAEALALADRIAVMEAGKIRQLATPEEVFKRPANLFVAGFIGSLRMNLLPAKAIGGVLRVGDSTVQLPSSAKGLVADGEEVILGSRPEFTTLEQGLDGDGIVGTVSILENLGTEYLVTVESGDLSVQLTVDDGEEPAIGDRVRVRPIQHRALVYRAGDDGLVGSPTLAPAAAVAAPVEGAPVEGAPVEGAPAR
jgi:multiple sugar transport system ATP-binding protein